ncbi:MAG: hypothetical protein KQI35_04245 [Bacteroidetes bacterium]|nr:hypothetical protein [Bacteroidota bacterium]
MRYILLVLFLQIIGFSYSQGLQFYKEKLDFTLRFDEFNLDGYYFFYNQSPDTIKQFILYPFPQSSGLGEITTISIKSLYPGIDSSVLVNFNQKAAGFRVKVYPLDSAVIHVNYIQTVPHRKAEYILTTTQEWNRPLAKADFTLSIPFNLKVDSLSYDADSLFFSSGKVIYKWNFTNFKPDRNFFVSFSKIEKNIR